MPLRLRRSNNLQAETIRDSGAGQAFFAPRRQVFRLSGQESGTQEVSLRSAVRTLERILYDKNNAANAALQGLRQYIGHLKPAHRTGDFLAQGNDPSAAPCWLHSQNWQEFQQVHKAAEASEPVCFMNCDIAMVDFVYLAHYIMTHTSLDHRDGQTTFGDPRLTLIDTINFTE